MWNECRGYREGTECEWHIMSLGVIDCSALIVFRFLYDLEVLWREKIPLKFLRFLSFSSLHLCPNSNFNKELTLPSKGSTESPSPLFHSKVECTDWSSRSMTRHSRKIPLRRSETQWMMKHLLMIKNVDEHQSVYLGQSCYLSASLRNQQTGPTQITTNVWDGTIQYTIQILEVKRGIRWLALR